MIQANSTTYAGFKAVFSALGGSNKTTTIFSTTGGFTAVVIFPTLQLVVSVTLPVAPLTFAVDFPQAVQVDGPITIGS